jgi:hypothetical protein
MEQIQQGLNERLVEPLLAAGTGEVIGPLQFDEDSVFVKVDECVPQPFEEVQEALVTSASSDGSFAIDAFVRRATPRADITVDPRFGSWDEDDGVVVTPSGKASVPVEAPARGPCEPSE